MTGALSKSRLYSPVTPSTTILGGSYIKALTGSANLNDYRVSQTYALLEPTALSNAPSGLDTNRGFMSVLQKESYVGQLIYSEDGRQFWRWGLANGTYWGGWQTIEVNIPSFYKDYSTLSDLAIGLGINGGGIKWTTAYRSTDEGYPFSDWGGVLLLGIERYGIEFCVQYQGNKLYYRMHWQDTVYGWKEITHS